MTPEHPGPVPILLADPHPIFRWGLRVALEVDPRMRVIGEVGTGVDAIARAMVLRPAVVVTELDLRDGTALPTIRVLRAVVPKVRVLVVADRTDPLSALAALEAGADGIVTKQSGADVILRTVLALGAGERVLDRDAIVAFVDDFLDHRALPSAPAVDRCRIVQAHLAAGATSEEIAAALGMETEAEENRLVPAPSRRGRSSGGGERAMPRDEAVQPIALVLTQEERATLEEAAAVEQQVWRWRRYRALLLLADGMTPPAVALALGCTLGRISDWVAAWRAGGLEGVREKPRRGPARSLDAAGEALLAGLLAEDPQTRGHRAAGWTAPLLRTELAAAGYTLSEHTIRRSLRRLGFRWKPPAFVPGVTGTEPASGQSRATVRSG